MVRSLTGQVVLLQVAVVVGRQLVDIAVRGEELSFGNALENAKSLTKTAIGGVCAFAVDAVRSHDGNCHNYALSVGPDDRTICLAEGGQKQQISVESMSLADRKALEAAGYNEQAKAACRALCRLPSSRPSQEALVVYESESDVRSHAATGMLEGVQEANVFELIAPGTTVKELSTESPPILIASMNTTLRDDQNNELCNIEKEVKVQQLSRAWKYKGEVRALVKVLDGPSSGLKGWVTKIPKQFRREPKDGETNDPNTAEATWDSQDTQQLDGSGHDPPAECHHLQTNTEYDSVAAALSDLNDGALPCKDGILKIYSETYDKYFLLWRSDQRLRAEKALNMTLERKS